MGRYLRAGIRLFPFLLLLVPCISFGERLQPSDLVYQGAFRLPDDFNWGARGVSYYPPGNSGAGSLLVTGFELLFDQNHPGESCWDPSWNCSAYYGEIAIPAPAIETNWENLPQATLLGGMVNFDGGLASSVHREYVFVSDMEYVPRRGTQTADKVYGSIEFWYAEGAVGEHTFPTIWMANLNGSGARGMFHVGPETTPYHGRKMGSYLFTVPQWYADRYLGGRILVTGRSRGTPVGYDPVTTQGGSQGPTLFAFQALNTDNPTGNLDALPFLYYRVKFPGCAGPNVGDPSQCDYPAFTMCDSWTGGAFVDNGSRQAILLLGYKGLGTNCYDEPPVECNDPCSDSHGYHCNPYERQIIFYDVDELGENVSSATPWTVLPYTIWRPDVFYLQGDVQGNVCGDVGGMAVDPAGGRLFMVERGLGGTDNNAAVVHVWTFSSFSCPPCSGGAVSLSNVRFPSGSTCRCEATSIAINTGVTIPSGAVVEFIASSSITVKTGSGLAIPDGATVTFSAPLVTIRAGVTIANGARVHFRQ
ncbi:MAG: hypothetical protein U5R49_25710 [Deltaproteobacteria bacterium]|nr:hypothetical protein [Deltaproteobacteria bacterium]